MECILPVSTYHLMFFYELLMQWYWRNAALWWAFAQHMLANQTRWLRVCSWRSIESKSARGVSQGIGKLQCRFGEEKAMRCVLWGVEALSCWWRVSTFVGGKELVKCVAVSCPSVQKVGTINNVELSFRSALFDEDVAMQLLCSISLRHSKFQRKRLHGA